MTERLLKFLVKCPICDTVDLRTERHPDPSTKARPSPPMRNVARIGIVKEHERQALAAKLRA